ncbi:sugar ABC transporter permease [Fervidibacillus albus]|uniref:Maltose/maltodextrin transport system permease protein n=2 Tax=Fervidibacillus albus TaxID=2980026 RepID=A0A9E8RW30_9BACI|nr:sugar ABC transporter permease [Fervidibacillus albus]
MVLSILFAGLGQLYNRRYGKGALLIIVETAYLIVFADYMNIGFWGLFTLGEIPMVDHSIFLLIQGLISVILLAFGLTVYIVNIRDAYKEAKEIRGGKKRPTWSEALRHAWDTGFPYIFITPGVVMLMFVTFLPIMFMIALAFTNYNQYNSPPRKLLDWVGFENFINLVRIDIWSDTLFSVLAWTLIWTLVATTLQIALGLFLALLVNDPRIKGKKMIRTILILPWAVPAFVTILIFAAMFNDQFGAINKDILSVFGLSIPWLTDPFYTKIALIMIQTWLGFPFVFALFTGVLQSISKDWYEAAEVDGGNRWQKFRYITLPHILYATAPLLIMQYTGNFNNFNIIYLFNQGGPAVRGQNAGGTDILISWVYKLTFETNNFNMAAAISIIIGFIVIGFAFFQFRRTRSFKEEGNI